MAITLADFNKIWASTSPLTPYSFSESNYKQGWNFVGSTPPARQMWDFLQKNNDEKMQYLANNYLPLSGGTMTGAINTSNSTSLRQVGSSSSVRIFGGTGDSDGANFWAFGRDSSGAGRFSIMAVGLNNIYSELRGLPDGTLTWGGNDIALAKDFAPAYTKNGNNPSITVPQGTYILIVYSYSFGAPSISAVYVGLLGGGDYNDGTQHIGVVDILKGSGYAGLGLTYSITTNDTKKITVSTTGNNINIAMIKIM